MVTLVNIIWYHWEKLLRESYNYWKVFLLQFCNIRSHWKNWNIKLYCTVQCTVLSTFLYRSVYFDMLFIVFCTLFCTKYCVLYTALKYILYWIQYLIFFMALFTLLPILLFPIICVVQITVLYSILCIRC